MKKIYVVTGQTATGKTSYALELAKKTNGELINCDSRQIYKGLDIITGKDLDKTSKQFTLQKSAQNFDIGTYTFVDSSIPIWLYDIINPNIPFSTFDYRTCALLAIDDIIRRNKTPIIIGGTYFYLKQLLYGTVETFIEPNIKLREELNTKTVYELQNILRELDEELLEQLNNSERNNPHRLIRKIEILKSDSTPHEKDPSLAELFAEYEIEITGFKFSNKESLTHIITQRVEERLEMGAIEEVKQLLTKYSEVDPGLKTIGYSQIINYLQKKTSLDQMKNEWITKEIQYAKRQLTFMKSNPQIIWQEV